MGANVNPKTDAIERDFWLAAARRKAGVVEYVRFERHARHHAIYLDLRLGMRKSVQGSELHYITYCGREVAESQIHELSFSPAVRCRCCVSRMRNPYLIEPD